MAVNNSVLADCFSTYADAPARMARTAYRASQCMVRKMILAWQPARSNLHDRIESIELGHRDIRDDHIGLKSQGRFDQLPAILHDFAQFIGRFQEAA